MKLYHFPSPNPQKVTFGLLELGLGLRTDPGRFGERRTARAGIPGGQSRRAGSGPRRRRRDADGIASDPRLSW